MFDGHYKRTIWDGQRAGARDHAIGAEWYGYVGANGHYEHNICGGLDAGVDVVAVISGTPAANTI